jgi:tetratricopeptide (TPR) repeat protein
MKQGRYDDSIAQYRKALDKDPSFVNSLGGIGTDQLFKKDYPAARETFEQQRAKSPDLAGQLDALGNVASSYVYEGKPAEAARVFDDVARRASQGGLTSRAVGAHLDAATVLADAGRGAEALQQVGQAQSVAGTASLPSSVQARLRAATELVRARGLAADGKVDEARTAIDKARAGIAQRGIPAEMEALNETQGTLALRQKHYEDAIGYLQKADQENPRVLYQLAMANQALGHTQQAATLFDKVAHWNSMGLDYAMVRSEAMEKAEANPVATSGKKKR